MEHPDSNPDRDLFRGIYATKLKELHETPYCYRDFSELERMAQRCLEAMEKAVPAI